MDEEKSLALFLNEERHESFTLKENTESGSWTILNAIKTFMIHGKRSKQQHLQEFGQS